MGARTQEEARSFIVSSLRRRLGLVICREFARHRIRRVPYIGVPRAVVERRMQRGQLIGGPQARVPLYVPYADFFQYSSCRCVTVLRQVPHQNRAARLPTRELSLSDVSLT